MKNLKKIISVILAAVMTVSVMSVSAFAAAGTSLKLQDGATAVISAGYIYGLNAEGTKLADIKAQLSNAAASVKAFDSNNKAIADDEYIGTGTTVKLVNGESVSDQLTVIIFGDVDGDGAIDAFDLFITDKAINGIDTLSGAYALAADIDENGAPDINDYSAIISDVANDEPVDQHAAVELPKAIITEITPTAVDGITPDTAIELSATQTLEETEGKAYAEWDVDLVLSFNQTVNMSDIYLFGQYGTYDWAGDKLADSGTLAAGEEFSVIHTWLAAVLELPSFALTYTDIVTKVRDFKCAIYDKNATDGLEATVQLIMTEPNGTVHVIDTVNYTWVVLPPTLPEANIYEITPEAVGEITPDTAIELVATQTLEEIRDKVYADWDVDLVLSFNQAVNMSDIYLFGQYGTYDWAGDKLADSGTLAADEEFSVIHTWLAAVLELPSFALTYTDIVTKVRDFKCAIYSANAADGLKATLQLVMTEPNGTVHTIDTFNYTWTVTPPELPEVEIDVLSKKQFGNKGSLQYGDTTVTADLVLQFSAKDETSETIADKAYKDWNVDFIITFNKEIDGSKVYLFGKYGDYDWTGGPLSDEILVAGKKTALMSEWRGETVPYSAMVDYEFKCAIDVMDPPAGLSLTIQLIMTDPSTGARYVIDTFTHNRF